MDLGISGKRALVLAASRGLGHGIARALAAEGVQVLICGRTEEKLKVNCADIISAGGKADYVVADLSDAHFVETVVQAVADKLGGIDILVNNTGGPTPGTAEEMNAEKLYSFFQSMVVRIITLTNALLPQMKAQGFGRILTVASSGVIEPIGNLALSNTLRGALVGWNKTLSTEVAGFGITANLLLPGRIHTDRIDELDQANAARQGTSLQDVRSASLKTIPAGRLGTVDEFAAAGAFLCSTPASYITGIMLRVDGGAAKSL
ncbi:3-oxoacyl-[acyl-carrier protein] reductase [Agrobacterium vitis]|nr:3-oxoacyl-[acyl-carrier protein] reductase [Agrobacterium vitis]MBE1439163.1 3-oxoacyl-[acyl-carrier protein] reductase [Agrobacterium vitis]